MYIIQSINLKNIVSFKNVKLRLDKRSLTFCFGKNLDSDQANPTSNGVGKSLLFFSIPNLFYFSPPASTRKNSKKELLKAGSINSVKFTTPTGVVYECSQKAKGYTIIEDGVDLEFKRIPDAEKFIRSIFQIKEIEYYTYCYVSTQRPYLFQTDSDLNRLEHLTQLFRLESYDLMKSHFIKLLSSVKAQEVRLSVLEQKVVEYKSQLSKIDLSELKSTGSLKQQHVKLKGKQSKLSKEIHQLDKTLEVLITLKKIETTLDSLRERYKYSISPDKQYTLLLKERKLARKLEQYNEASATYKQSIKSLQDKLNSLVAPKLSNKKLENLKDSVLEKIVKLKKELEILDKENSIYLKQKLLVSQLKKELQDISIDISNLNHSDLEEELAQCRYTLKLEKLLNHSHLEGNTCPVCLSKVDLKAIAKLVKKSKSRISFLEEAEVALNVTKQLRKESKILSSLDNPKDFLEKKLEELKVLRQSEEEAFKGIRQWKLLKDLQEQISLIQKPSKPTVLPSLDLSLEVLDQHIELCTDILKQLEAKSRLLENYPELKLCKTVKQVGKNIKEVTKQLNELHPKLATLNSKIEEVYESLKHLSVLKSKYSGISEEIKVFQKEIQELLPSIKDKQALEVLIKAYSTKGLKTIVANEIAQLLETNLNHYSSLIFMEPFSFSVKVTETGMSILVDRQNGIVSDVRNLSGAESNSFRMLFLLSILVLVPSERRMNLLVLDEPNSHQDQASKDLFLESYLPVLQEIVPNIVIITPNRSDIVKGSSVLVVTKEQGISTIKHETLA